MNIVKLWLVGVLVFLLCCFVVPQAEAQCPTCPNQVGQAVARQAVVSRSVTRQAVTRQAVPMQAVTRQYAAGQFASGQFARRAQWTYPGEIHDHLASGHGFNAAGMSRAQAEAEHDRLHNAARGSSRGVSNSRWFRAGRLFGRR